MSTAPAGTAQVAAARNLAAESPDAAADLRPCGVPGKAPGFPSWSGAENASQGRDEAVLGVLLRAAALRGGRRRRSRFRAAAGCRLPASPHPALRSSPKTEIPFPAALSKLSPLLPGACREAGARWARGLGGAEGGSPAPFSPCQDTALGKPLLSLREETSPQSRAVEPRSREQRGGPGPPPPLSAAAPCLLQVVPRSLWKRFPGCVLAGSCCPRSPAALPSAGAQPPCRGAGRAAPALPAGRPVRRLQADSDHASAPNCRSAELPAKTRHPKRCRCDARRPSPCSEALCRRCACRTDRSFSSREGERNRPRSERRGFFLGISSEADWAFCGGSPARAPALCAFLQLVVTRLAPSRRPAPPRLFPE